MNRRLFAGFAVACLLIALGILSRLIPHPPNFTPVAALAMFGSFYFGSWKLGTAVPVVSLVLSDIVLGMYEPSLMAAVYASSLVPLVFGRMLRQRLKPGRVLLCALCSSIAFYMTTNFAVWLFGSWYASDWNGLTTCFVAGIPFFRYTLTSDLLFSSAIFGTYAFLVHFRTGFEVARAWLAARNQPAQGHA
jgi:hypothetical protein